MTMFRATYNGQIATLAAHNSGDASVRATKIFGLMLNQFHLIRVVKA
jgi:hypothetical protein